MLGRSHGRRPSRRRSPGYVNLSNNRVLMNEAAPCATTFIKKRRYTLTPRKCLGFKTPCLDGAPWSRVALEVLQKSRERSCLLLTRMRWLRCP
jgi:hypothetical protein